ncbi:MAG: transketolase [Oscillospiraceae bacterium]
MTDKKLLKDLQRFALEIRLATIEELGCLGFGHVGGSLSIADAMAVLYGSVMNVDPKNPTWPDRDKFVSSKGHAGPVVYATLALKGYFPKEDLKTLNKPGTHYPSHCDRKMTVGVDMTTGSLGQGTSLACGMALGDKLKGRPSRTFLVVGDGECDEGQVWEAAMFAAAKKLDNMVWLIDNNKKQLDGWTKDILDTGDLAKKFEAFGFDTVKINGNDVEQLYDAVTKKTEGKPIAVIMDTVKGKGVKEVEETMSNHSMAVKPEVWEKWANGLREELAAFAN